MSYQDIKKKILEFDEEVIDMNALENLQKLLPTKEQVCFFLLFKDYVILWYILVCYEGVID